MYLEPWIYWDVLWFLLPSNNYEGTIAATRAPQMVKPIKGLMLLGDLGQSTREVTKATQSFGQEKSQVDREGDKYQLLFQNQMQHQEM